MQLSFQTARRAPILKRTPSAARPIAVYLALALLALASFFVKTIFLLHLAWNSRGFFRAWSLFDYVFVYLIDIALYLGIRLALDLIRRLPIPTACDTLVLKTAYVLAFVLTWYTLSSAHYYLLMGDHLTLPVFLAADVRRMDYLRPTDHLVLVTEFCAVLLLFAVLIPRMRIPSRPVVRWSCSRRHTVYLVCSFLVLGMLTLQFRRPSWAFNLEKNAVVTVITSLFSNTEHEERHEYSFAAKGDLILSSKYNPMMPLPGGTDLPRFSATERPNLVMFVMESASARHLPVYGNGVAYMPNLTRLTNQGALFESVYCHTSNSANAVPSLFCSIYPHPSRWASVGAFPDISCDSLQRILKGRGYATAIFSRWDFDFMSVSPFFLNNGVDRLRFTRLVRDEDQTQIQNEEQLVEYAMNWAEKQAGPFFLTIWPVPAHMPGVELESRFLRFGGSLRSYKDDYYNQLFYQDYLVGLVVERLERSGKLADSILVLVGDHGQGVGTAGADFAHSNYLYEDVTRIPLLVVAPKVVHGPIRIPGITQQIDLVPTLTGMLGLSGSYNHQGRDISLARNRGRRIVYFTWAPGRILGLLDERWKYLLHTESGLEEVYDLGSDPLEHHNMVRTEPMRSTYYRGLVEDWAIYEQDYYRGMAGTPKSGEFDKVFIAPGMARLTGGEQTQLVYGPRNRGKQLYTNGQVYASGFSVPVGADFLIDLTGRRGAERFEAIMSPESAYCDQRTMPWNVVFRKGERMSFTALFQNCAEHLPVELDVAGCEQLQISIRMSGGSGHSGLKGGRLVFGNAAIGYRRGDSGKRTR